MRDNLIHDALIIGAGAAGASCAVWLARLGFLPLLVEAGPRVGGLCLVHPFADDWNASLPMHTGPQVADNFALSLQRAKVPVLLSTSVVRLGRAQEGFIATTQDGSSLRGHHIVLATGTRARTLPGVHAADWARPFPGVLVGPGDHIVEQQFKGKKIAVLGGGDNAFENALYALDHGAAQVHVYARSVRAQQQFLRRISPQQLICGEVQVEPLARRVNGSVYDLIMVFYGWEPCVDFADDLGLARTVQGFIQTQMATAQTSCEGVYAIGEVAHRFHPCVVTGMADGVTAAKAIQARIESVRTAHG